MPLDTSAAIAAERQNHSLRQNPRFRARDIFGYLWVAVLCIFIIFAVYEAYQRATRVEEYAYGCDPFGYLNTAKQIRGAVAHKQPLKFWIETPKAELLIDFLQSHNVPLPLWQDLVTPLAYRYMPGSGHIGCQYPPGTGVVLALFPEGKAVVRLNAAFILLSFAFGFVGLVLAGARRLWVSAGFVALALYLGLRIIERIGGWSFSINAALPVILLTSLCLFAAIWLGARTEKARQVWLVVFCGGLFLGLGVFIRLAVVFLAPGFLVLLWRRPWTLFLRDRVLPFTLGVVLAGIIPVLVFQQYDTGAWYVPSYPPWATTAPNLHLLRSNLAYYLGNGPGSTDNWAVAVSAIALAALIRLRYKCGHGNLALGLNHLAVAFLLAWGIPTAYFITHQTTIPYYSIPGNFGSVVLLAFGVLTIEYFSTARDVLEPTTPWCKRTWAPFAVCLLPGLATLAGGVPPVRPRLTTTFGPRVHAHQFVLPARLADDRAWIWADYLSGTFWYYADKPAFKIAHTDQNTRALIYRFVFDRGEPQYFVQDSPFMTGIMGEITRMGGLLEPIPGGVDSTPFFLIHWPKDGPMLDGQHSSASLSPPRRNGTAASISRDR